MNNIIAYYTVICPMDGQRPAEGYHQGLRDCTMKIVLQVSTMYNKYTNGYVLR